MEKSVVKIKEGYSYTEIEELSIMSSPSNADGYDILNTLSSIVDLSDGQIKYCFKHRSAGNELLDIISDVSSKTSMLGRFELDKVLQNIATGYNYELLKVEETDASESDTRENILRSCKDVILANSRSRLSKVDSVIDQIDSVIKLLSSIRRDNISNDILTKASDSGNDIKNLLELEMELKDLNKQPALAGLIGEVVVNNNKPDKISNPDNWKINPKNKNKTVAKHVKRTSFNAAAKHLNIHSNNLAAVAGILNSYGLTFRQAILDIGVLKDLKNKVKETTKNQELFMIMDPRIDDAKLDELESYISFEYGLNHNDSDEDNDGTGIGHGDLKSASSFSRAISGNNDRAISEISKILSTALDVRSVNLGDISKSIVKGDDGFLYDVNSNQPVLALDNTILKVDNYLVNVDRTVGLIYNWVVSYLIRRKPHLNLLLGALAIERPGSQLSSFYSIHENEFKLSSTEKILSSDLFSNTVINRKPLNVITKVGYPFVATYTGSGGEIRRPMSIFPGLGVVLGTTGGGKTTTAKGLAHLLQFSMIRDRDTGDLRPMVSSDVMYVTIAERMVDTNDEGTKSELDIKVKTTDHNDSYTEVTLTGGFVNFIEYVETSPASIIFVDSLDDFLKGIGAAAGAGISSYEAKSLGLSIMEFGEDTGRSIVGLYNGSKKQIDEILKYLGAKSRFYIYEDIKDENIKTREFFLDIREDDYAIRGDKIVLSESIYPMLQKSRVNRSIVVDDSIFFSNQDYNTTSSVDKPDVEIHGRVM